MTSFPRFFVLSALLSVTSVMGQEIDSEELPQEENPLARFSWQVEGVGDIGREATIKIPEGFVFLNGKETAEVMELFGNLPSKYEGMIGPEGLEWFVIFEHEAAGYVDDSEKADLDPDELLTTLQQNQEYSNEQRKAAGLDTLTLTGWAKKPAYNETTNHLEWGIILEGDDGSQTVNYLTKLLGRSGIMHTTLLCDPKDLEANLPSYQTLLADFSYREGKTYADYEEGDKLAEYGLKGLVAGGAVFAAAKLGLFAKIALFFKKGFKFIILGVIAIWALLKRVAFGKSADA